MQPSRVRTGVPDSEESQTVTHGFTKTSDYPAVTDWDRRVYTWCSKYWAVQAFHISHALYILKPTEIHVSFRNY